MRRSGLSSALALAVLLLPAYAQQLTCRNGRCERVIYGSAPAPARLRINAHGPVTLEGGAAKDLSYSIKVVAIGRTDAEARRALQAYAVRLESGGPWTVLTAPGGPIETTVSVKSARLLAATISTSDGAVHATGIEGPLDIDTG